MDASCMAAVCASLLFHTRWRYVAWRRVPPGRCRMAESPADAIQGFKGENIDERGKAARPV
ncbi:MAG: hypothetical protein LBU82_00430 [Treponema sp.]|nr:hypothetical protein [Treponema sp.]